MNPIKRWREGSNYLGPIAVVLGFAAAVPCFAQTDKKPAEAATKPMVTTGTTGLTYHPPVRGNPVGRVGGGTRSGGLDRAVVLSVLAPEHVGLTTKEQPTLYWFISQPTNSAIELTLIESKTPKPLLETKIDPPNKGGIQRVRLTDYNVRLKPDTEYRWYVALVPDPKNRSKDILAGGFISRMQATKEQEARLSQATLESARAFAAEGVWYDAIAAISEAIEVAGGDNSLRAQRASLLEQVKLQPIAEFDRAGASR